MARKASTPTPAAGSTVATVTPVLTGHVLDATAGKNLDAARADVAWKEYLSLPSDTPAAERQRRLTALLAAGDLDAGDRVKFHLDALNGATLAWARTARAAHAASLAGMSVPSIARALGATTALKASEGNGKKVTRMLRGWTLVLADNATLKSGDALRQYVIVGNVITDGDTKLAVAALASGKGIAAIAREVLADKSPTPKATSTPRVASTPADAPADTPADGSVAAAVASPTDGDLAGVLAGMTDANLAAVAVAVARACKARKFRDADAARGLADVLVSVAGSLDPAVAALAAALADEDAVAEHAADEA